MAKALPEDSDLVYVSESRWTKEIASPCQRRSDELTDEELVAKVDCLMYQLKYSTTSLALDLRKHLRVFTADNQLDLDQHMFATLPKEATSRIDERSQSTQADLAGLGHREGQA